MAKLDSKKNGLMVIGIIYILCYGFRLLEYFVIRTDQTWIGEAFVHKLIGIGILFLLANYLGFTMNEIGYSKEHCVRKLLAGLAFGLGVFVIAYGVEVLIAVAQGHFHSLQVYVTAYAIEQNIGYQTEWIFFVICILGNIINVVMEEGIFRGLFERILQEKYSFLISAIISAVLFGFWHIIGPIRNYCDGTTSMQGMIANVIMLLVTSALVGFKFAMITKMTGSQYMAMGDHFVNNTIVNLLHVVTDTGVDQLMVVRISIAQSVSFILVLIFYICYCNNRKKKRKE